MNRDLPIADRRQVRRAALRLVRRDVPGFTATLLLNSLAAAAALVSPWLLGRIIDSISIALASLCPPWSRSPGALRFGDETATMTVLETGGGRDRRR